MTARSSPPWIAATVAGAALLVAACNGSGPTPATETPSGSPQPEPTSPVEPAGTPPPAFDLATEQALLTVTGIEAGDFTRTPQGLAQGDFNDDGRPDLLIGAEMANGPENGREAGGEAYVVFGDDDGPAEISLAASRSHLTIYGAAPGDGLGFSVLAADFNDDGIDDVIVGAPGVTGTEDPRTDQGQVYVLFGSPDLTGGSREIGAEPADLTITGAEGFSRLGHATAAADVNDDGRTDLILGAPFAGREPDTPPGGPRTEIGEVYVFFGDDSLTGDVSAISADQDFTMAGRQRFGQFGATVAAADVNGDGTSDIIVGAPQEDQDGESRPAAGAVYAFFGASDLGGKRSIADGDDDVRIVGHEAGAGFGSPLAGGDLDGDGIGDVIAGAQRATGPGDVQSVGATAIVFGREGLEGAVDLASGEGATLLYGARPGLLLPSALATGDVTGDGAADLLLGAAQAGPEARERAGLVYVIPGGPDLAGETFVEDAAELVLTGAEAEEAMGSALALALFDSGPAAIAALAPGGPAGRAYLAPLP